MKAESSHFTMRELREKQQESIAWAKEVGITQMITATLGGGNNPTMDDVKRAADEYNQEERRLPQGPEGLITRWTSFPVLVA